jgi:hypothetical protein
MLISDTLLEQASEEPLAVVVEACTLYINASKKEIFSSLESESLEIVKFLFYMKKSGALDFKADIPEISSGLVSKEATRDFVGKVLAEVNVILKHHKTLQLEAEIDARFTRSIKNSFGYEFTEGDFKELQSLVNKLRDLIASCKDLDADHKRRLHKKLEQVQQELHKKVSSLDHIYALAIEASIVAGKVGENAKPLFEAAKQLMGISWRTHAHSEGLPSSSEAPMLGHESTPKNIE